jgi:signal transduction histidine kinase
LEEERRQIETKMREAQKFESLGLISAGVAHYFNNLLSRFLLQLSVIEAAPPEVAADRCALGKLAETAKAGAALCQQLLVCAGTGSQRIAPVNLGELVAGMEDLLRVSIGPRATLTVRLPPSLPVIEGDSDQLRQVVLNLVLNASEALGNTAGVVGVEAGTLSLSQEEIAAAAVAGPGVAPGEHVFLRVSDAGCGMSPATLARVFDPFFTTKFIGRGLGLAAVAGIVRGHRGALSVESQLNVGSTFQLFLPVARPQS